MDGRMNEWINEIYPIFSILPSIKTELKGNSKVWKKIENDS